MVTMGEEGYWECFCGFSHLLPPPLLHLVVLPHPTVVLVSSVVSGHPLYMDNV